MSRPKHWAKPMRQVEAMRVMEPMILPNGKTYVFTVPDGSYISNAIKNHEKYKLIFDTIKEMMQTPEYSHVKKDNAGLPNVDHITYTMIIEKAFERTPYRWLPENEIYIKNMNPANALTVSHMKVSRWYLPRPKKSELSSADYKKARQEYENEQKSNKEEGIGMTVKEWGELAREEEEERLKERQAKREAERLASMPPPPPPEEKKQESIDSSSESDDEIVVTPITYDKYSNEDRSKKRKPKTYLKAKKMDKHSKTYDIYSHDDDTKLIGDMTRDGLITFQYGRRRKNEDEPLEGYDSETDRLDSDYPYEIITTYQESPETIAKYKALHYANKALTEEQRRNGWQAEWNDTRKQPYYFNEYYSDDDEYEGATGTETRLNSSYNIIYEPYDVNSLPNYDRYSTMIDGPLPSNNSIAAEARAKAAAEARAKVAAEQSRAESVAPPPPPPLAEPSLPPNWTEQFSRTHQRKYWHNSMTGKTSWERPTSGGKKKRKSKRKLNKKSKRNTRRK